MKDGYEPWRGVTDPGVDVSGVPRGPVTDDRGFVGTGCPGGEEPTTEDPPGVTTYNAAQSGLNLLSHLRGGYSRHRLSPVPVTVTLLSVNGRTHK